MDEKKGKLSNFNKFKFQNWRDELRVWNETFPLLCLDYLVLPHGSETGLWIPDLAIVSADSFMKLTKSANFQLKVHSDGTVEWAPGGLIRFKCDMNLQVFPFDSMHCIARSESWAMDIKREVFDDSQKVLTLINFTNHEQWQLIAHYVKYQDLFFPTSNMTYGSINFNAILKRKTSYYLVNLILPCIILSLLEIVTFILPENQAIRIQVSVLLLLAYTMFLAIIQADLPRSSDQTPLLTVYVTLMIIYVSLAIIFQCIVMMLTSKASVGSEIPEWFVEYFLQKFPLSYFITIDDDRHWYKQQTTKPQAIRSIFQMEEGKDQKKKAEATTLEKNKLFWTRLYISLDKFAALSYCILIAATSILLLGIIPKATTQIEHQL